MGGLIDQPGRFRNQSVGIVHGKEIAHIAPPAVNVPFLIKDLFSYLKDDEDLILIKSCVFHYEMKFIHPFLDGNGCIGRLWQTIILSKANPVFEFLPLETLIIQTQISKIENNIKEARISTLQKIIKLGFGGHLELSVKL